MNYYERLGIPRDASGNAIRTAYRRLVLGCHPDIAGAGSAEKFRQVQEAYETLGEPSRRHAYDLSLRPRSRPVAVTVIRSRPRVTVDVEPLVPRRRETANDPPHIDQLFVHLLRLFEEIW